MTKFNQRRFSVSAPINDSYAENYERTFGKDVRVASSCDIGMPKIAIARVEIEKWIARLDSALGDINEKETAGEISFVIESLKLILKADRITDALARK
jgi:hypothetical protein